MKKFLKEWIYPEFLGGDGESILPFIIAIIATVVILCV